MILNPNARRARRGNRRGMTLVEVMVVIAIILTLTSVLAYGIFQVYGQSQGQMTRLTMGKVSQRVEIYQLRKKKPPSTSEGLAAVFGNETLPADGWGNPLIYVSPGPNGQAFDLISYGPDGAEGGGDDIRMSEDE